MMDEPSGSKSLIVLANESKHEITSISPSILHDLGESSMEQTEFGSCLSTFAESIEKSKSHWSQVREFDSDNEVAEVSNVELFQTLQRHPTWGTFFKVFGGDGVGYGQLVMGKKFAEGGQAELYEAQINWKNAKRTEDDRKNNIEWVLKVFKKGTFLRHLQSQWPRGMLQFHANKRYRRVRGLSPLLRWHSAISGVTMLEDGRFAFVIVKEEEDLRSMIDRCMLTRPKDKGPFSKDEAEEIMLDIAYGMHQLHGRGIIHRDIKASNVLRSRNGNYHIADFECSVGVVGTGFFRAPEILQACKERIVNKAGLFTKAVDVYSYGMTCYEILTGQLPFDGHPNNEYDFVLEGQRPELPKDVDDWVCKLLKRCWESNPIARPSFGDILKVLIANSKIYRERHLRKKRLEIELGIRKDSKVTILRRSLRLKLKRMSLVKRNPSC